MGLPLASTDPEGALAHPEQLKAQSVHPGVGYIASKTVNTLTRGSSFQFK